MSLNRYICTQCDARLVEPGGVRLEPARGVLTWNGGQVRLATKPARFLVALIDADRIVTREALTSTLWGDAPDGEPKTADNSLSVVAHSIRRAFNKAGCPLAIRSWRGEGYELIAKG